MSNQNSSITKEVKDAIHELSTIYEEIGKKVNTDKKEGEKTFDKFKKDIEKLKNHFEEIGKELVDEGSQALNNAGEEASSVVDSVQNRLEEVKPFFENLIENLTDPQIKLGELVDIAALKMKLASIHARIFVRKKASEFLQKAQGKEEANMRD